MAISKKSALKKHTNRKTAYLTRRILVQAAKAGSKEAAVRTMKAMGYNVIVLNGAVVRKYPNGSIQEIKRVRAVNRKVTTKAALKIYLHKEAK